jgi:hypothetical protein
LRHLSLDRDISRIARAWRLLTFRVARIEREAVAAGSRFRACRYRSDFNWNHRISPILNNRGRMVPRRFRRAAQTSGPWSGKLVAAVLRLRWLARPGFRPISNASSVFRLSASRLGERLRRRFAELCTIASGEVA